MKIFHDVTMTEQLESKNSIENAVKTVGHWGTHVGLDNEIKIERKLYKLFHIWLLLHGKQRYVFKHKRLFEASTYIINSSK